MTGIKSIFLTELSSVLQNNNTTLSSGPEENPRGPLEDPQGPLDAGLARNEKRGRLSARLTAAATRRLSDGGVFRSAQLNFGP